MANFFTSFLTQGIAGLLGFFFIIPLEQARAAWQVDQTIEQKIGAQSHEFAFHWQIDGGRFSLTVDSKSGKALYLFNGTNFYVCRQLGPELKALLEKYKLNKKEIENYFSQGICQEAPTNFLVKFYIDPVDAILGLDLSDGLALTHKFSSFSLKAQHDEKETPSSAASAQECDNWQRSYKLTKKTTSNQEKILTFSDQSCVSSGIKWREKFQREVYKRILRQTDMRASLKDVKAYVSPQDGLILSSLGQFQRFGAKGEVISGDKHLSSGRVAQVKINDKNLELPSTYKVMDEKSLENLTSGENSNGDKLSSDSTEGGKTGGDKTKDKQGRIEAKTENGTEILLFMILGGIL